MNDNADCKFRDDAFDLRRASDNPLLENQLNKTDWDKSNKVCGFNVDFSNQNQQIFTQFTFVNLSNLRLLFVNLSVEVYVNMLIKRSYLLLTLLTIIE
jgi:hypothetical protein